MSPVDLLGPDPQRMARDVRLVASDLDGTLIGPDFGFRPRTREALDALEAAGVPVVFVTGRPSRWLHPLRDLHALREAVAEQVRPIGAVICSNGALVYDLASDTVLSSSTLNADTGREAVARLRAAAPGVLFSAETLRGVAAEPQWLGTDQTRIRNPRVGPLEEVLEDDDRIVKLLARHHESAPQVFVDLVRRTVGDLTSVTHSVPQAAMAELARHGLSKAEALASYCAERGVDRSEVLAFGDMTNDLQMLQWAGYGYALASGDPSVVAAVRRTAPAFDQDGVAQVIEQLLAVRAGLAPGD